MRTAYRVPSRSLDNATAMARIEARSAFCQFHICERAVLPVTRRRPQGMVPDPRIARAVLVLSALHVSHPMLLDTQTIICVHLPSKKGAHLIYQIVGKPLTALFRVFRRYKNTDDQIQEHGRTLVLMLPPTPTPPTPPTPTPPRGPRSRRDDHRVLQHTR